MTNNYRYYTILSGFNVTILDVNETYAKVFWKIIGSNCDQVTVKGKYWLSLKQDDSTLFREDIYNNTPIKAFGNLTPSTKYEVFITEASERNGVGIDIFRHAFETSTIGMLNSQLISILSPLGRGCEDEIYGI